MAKAGEVDAATVLPDIHVVLCDVLHSPRGTQGSLSGLGATLIDF